MVNGPEGVTLSWDAVDWRHHEDNVRRLRQRIFTAAQDGDLAMVRNLQKLMLRSWSNTLISVRQATQRNAGRKTPGIDGEVALTSPARMELAVQVHRDASSWRPRPVKRVYIPKAGNRAKLRPLGIPVIADRCHQGRVRAALEPDAMKERGLRSSWVPGKLGVGSLERQGRPCERTVRGTTVRGNRSASAPVGAGTDDRGR